MRKEVIGTGKNVEEAIVSACEKLGFERDDIEWEIISLPKKGFLGLKNIPAKVKVWKDIPDPKPVSRQTSKSAPAEKPSAPAEKSPVKKEQPKSAPARREEKKQTAFSAAPVAEKSAPAKPAPAPKSSDPIEITGEVAAKVQVATDYLAGICKEMGLNATFTSQARDGGVCLNIEGEGLGAVIGRRGETLDALQYLVSLVANRLEGDYLRLTLDCGDYRLKRKATLEALARKLSAQVLKTNSSKTLEPMNPFERRIIHATVSEIEGVSSTSIGEEPNRRVVITSPTARPARSSGGSRGGNNRRSGNHSSGGGGRDGGGDRSRRRSGPPRRPVRENTQGGTINTLPQKHIGTVEESPAQPKKTPEASTATDKPLYTKLDLE